MDAAQALGLTNNIYARLSARRPEIDTAEEYYGGKQPLSFATEEWRKANAARYEGFSDNWCASVVNAEAERLRPIGITNLSKSGANKLWDQFQYNEFDMQFSQGVITTLTAKRSFVIVWGDGDGNPVVTFEHPSQVEIEYDWENPRKRKAALKTWVDETNEYATLYTPHEVWKWVRKRAIEPNERKPQAQQSRTGVALDWGWEQREVDDVWPLRNPLGVVPVVEVANRPTLKGDPVSEIQGVMPMQDAINLLWAYLFLAADYASMDARVMLSSEPPMIPILDTEGKPIGSRPVEMKDLREKRLLSITGDNARIDSWKAAELSIFTDTIDVAVGHISSQSRTPPTYLVSKTGMSNVNSEGLKAAEIPLVMKSNEFITFTDPSLREVASLIARVMGDEKLASSARLAQFVWASREIRSESQMADALLKKHQMGVPLEYLLEIDGKSPTEIRRIMKMARAQQHAALTFGVEAALGGVDEPV